MPIYEYQCAGCGHRLESFQKMTDAPLTECPHCHKEQLQKLISAAGFQLKGTGWYATDFRDKGKKSETSGSKESKDNKETKESKSDSKQTVKEDKKTDSSSSSTDTAAS